MTTTAFLLVAIVGMGGFVEDAGPTGARGETTLDSAAGKDAARTGSVGDAPPVDPAQPLEEAPAAGSATTTAEPPPPPEGTTESDKRVPRGELRDPPSDSVGIERLDPMPMAAVQAGAGLLTLLGAGAVSYFGIALLSLPLYVVTFALGPAGAIIGLVVGAVALLALAAGTGALGGWVEWALGEWLGKQSLPAWQTALAGALTALAAGGALVVVQVLALAVPAMVATGGGALPLLVGVAGIGACVVGCVGVPVVPAWFYFSNAKGRGAAAAWRDEPRREAGPRQARHEVALAY